MQNTFMRCSQCKEDRLAENVKVHNGMYVCKECVTEQESTDTDPAVALAESMFTFIDGQEDYRDQVIRSIREAYAPTLEVKDRRIAELEALVKAYREYREFDGMNGRPYSALRLYDCDAKIDRIEAKLDALKGGE
jgi:hypothetical protein